MGGGAKGAYEVGVWEALWELGIRRFCSIAGTSVGALNAILIADMPPKQVKAVWHDVVENSVLQPFNKRIKVLSRVVVGYALFFTPLIAAAALILLRDQVISVDAASYCIAAMLLGGSLLAFSSLMTRIASFGVVIPLFKLRMSHVRDLGILTLVGGVAAVVMEAEDWEALIRAVFLLGLPIY
jgi:hypothetical protein